MTDHTGVYPLEDGWLSITCRGNAVSRIGFSPEKPEETGKTALSDAVFGQIKAWFSGERKELDFPTVSDGTDFQKRVWAELKKIPYGQTLTYGEVAFRVGCPGGARAVGMACNKNPLPFIVPCHRVVGKNGAMVGYALGLELKKRLLELEKEV